MINPSKRKGGARWTIKKEPNGAGAGGDADSLENAGVTGSIG